MGIKVTKKQASKRAGGLHHLVPRIKKEKTETVVNQMKVSLAHKRENDMISESGYGKSSPKH